MSAIQKMTRNEKKRWSVFILVWLTSGLLQFFFFRFLFFKTLSLSVLLSLGATHLAAALVYFLLTEKQNQQPGRVWPLQFFCLTFFMPGISFVFLPFFWAQKLEGQSLHSYSEEFRTLDLETYLPKTKRTTRDQFLEELEIEPYADIMAGNDIELKRGAIERMLELKNSESIALLKKYRSDDSSELRFYVLSALHRMRQDFEEELAAAKMEAQKNIYKTSARLDLAKLYLQYAHSGLLDTHTQDYYLNEARFHLFESLHLPDASEHAFEMLLELMFFQKDYFLAEKLLEEARLKKWCKLDVFFQKKSELYYLLKNYLALKEFVSSFPVEQLQNSESTQIYYAWGGAYAH